MLKNVVNVVVVNNIVVINVVGKVLYKLPLSCKVIQNDLTSPERTRNKTHHEMEKKKKERKDINVAIYMYYIHRFEACTQVIL